MNAIPFTFPIPMTDAGKVCRDAPDITVAGRNGACSGLNNALSGQISIVGQRIRGINSICMCE